MKLKTGLTLAGILGILALVALVNLQRSRIKSLRSDVARDEKNIRDLLQDNQVQRELYLTSRQVVGRIARERDSLAEVVKVKPKQIETIVTITNTIRDTIPVPVPVYPDLPDTWRISDRDNCFKWEGVARLVGDSLGVTRTSYESTNRTVSTFYRERSRRILGIPFGKWIYKHKTASDCGETREETIHFIK